MIVDLLFVLLTFFIEKGSETKWMFHKAGKESEI